jgi:hypothetical protein
MKSRLEREGADPVPGPPERLGEMMEADLLGWRRLIAEAKLQLE